VSLFIVNKIADPPLFFIFDMKVNKV